MILVIVLRETITISNAQTNVNKINKDIKKENYVIKVPGNCSGRVTHCEGKGAMNKTHVNRRVSNTKHSH